MPVQVHVQDYGSDGDAGVRRTLVAIGRLIYEASANPNFQEFAEAVVRKKVGVQERLTNRRAAQVMLDYVRANVRYRPDPPYVEMLKGPMVTLCVPGAGMCIPVEDCDGLTAAFGSLCSAYGIPVQVIKQRWYRNDEEEHVLIAVQDEEGAWLGADPSHPSLPVGRRVECDEEVWLDPTDVSALGLDQPSGRFVVVAGHRDLALAHGEWVERIGDRLFVSRGGQWQDRGPVVKHVSLGRLLEVDAVKAQLGQEVMPPAPGPSHGITTPGDVLAYRQTWEPYILGMVKALQACAAAWTAAAQGHAPATPINTAQFATPPDAQTLSLWASGKSDDAQNLLDEWNMHAGLEDWQIVVLAGDILQDFQHAVQKAGQWYAPQLVRDCPNVELPAPPSVDVQAQVVGRIEGLGILSHGVLQLFGIGANGVLVVAGQAADTLRQTLTSTLPWAAIAGVAGLVGGAFLMWKYSPRIFVGSPERKANPLSPVVVQKPTGGRAYVSGRELGLVMNRAQAHGEYTWPKILKVAEREAAGSSSNALRVELQILHWAADGQQLPPITHEPATDTRGAIALAKRLVEGGEAMADVRGIASRLYAMRGFGDRAVVEIATVTPREDRCPNPIEDILIFEFASAEHAARFVESDVVISAMREYRVVEVEAFHGTEKDLRELAQAMGGAVAA